LRTRTEGALVVTIQESFSILPMLAIWKNFVVARLDEKGIKKRTIF
jgi:hypothetical protein